MLCPYVDDNLQHIMMCIAWQVGDHSTVKESVEQRYQRLQHEIRELAEDVSRMKVCSAG